MHMLEAQSRKARHIQEEITQSEAREGQRHRVARTTRTARQEQGQGQEQGLNCMLELWKARSLLEGFLEQYGPDQKRWSKGKNENKNATDAHDLDSTNTGPEAEIGGSDMSFFQCGCC